MKSCTMLDFMEELKPWLDRDHIHRAELDRQGHFTPYFVDGMKNIYSINDCNTAQLGGIMKTLRDRGIKVENPS